MSEFQHLLAFDQQRQDATPFAESGKKTDSATTTTSLPFDPNRVAAQMIVHAASPLAPAVGPSVKSFPAEANHVAGAPSDALDPDVAQDVPTTAGIEGRPDGLALPAPIAGLSTPIAGLPAPITGMQGSPKLDPAKSPLPALAAEAPMANAASLATFAPRGAATGDRALTKTANRSANPALPGNANGGEATTDTATAPAWILPAVRALPIVIPSASRFATTTPSRTTVSTATPAAAPTKGAPPTVAKAKGGGTTATPPLIAWTTPTKSAAEPEVPTETSTANVTNEAQNLGSTPTPSKTRAPAEALVETAVGPGVATTATEEATVVEVLTTASEPSAQSPSADGGPSDDVKASSEDPAAPSSQSDEASPRAWLGNLALGSAAAPSRTEPILEATLSREPPLPPPLAAASEPGATSQHIGVERVDATYEVPQPAGWTRSTKETMSASAGSSSDTDADRSSDPQRTVPKVDGPASPSKQGSLEVPRVQSLETSVRSPDLQKAPGADTAANRTTAQGQGDDPSATSPSAPGSGNAAAPGPTLANPTPDPSQGVNGMTSAKDLSTLGHSSDSSKGLADVAAASSAANQAVIRSAAHGVVDLPGLGRIQVSARSEDGAIDVRVTADRPETTTILLPHAEAMASEVRSIGGSNVRVDIDSRGGAFTSHMGGSGSDGKESGGRRSPESPDPSDVEDVPAGPARQRVRIVL